MLLWDAMVAALALFYLIRGWRRGLAQSVLGLVGGLLALAVALWGAQALDDAVGNRVIYPLLGDTLSQRALEQTGLDGLEESEAAQVYQALTDALGEGLAQMGIVGESSLEAMEDPVGYVAGQLARGTARTIAFAVLFVLLFAAVNALLFVAVRALDMLTRLPLLGTANRLGGAILGVATAAVLSALLLYGASRLEPAWFQPGGEMSPERIEESYLIKYVAAVTPGLGQ